MNPRMFGAWELPRFTIDHGRAVLALRSSCSCERFLLLQWSLPSSHVWHLYYSQAVQGMPAMVLHLLRAWCVHLSHLRSVTRASPQLKATTSNVESQARTVLPLDPSVTGRCNVLLNRFFPTTWPAMTTNWRHWRPREKAAMKWLWAMVMLCGRRTPVAPLKGAWAKPLMLTLRRVGNMHGMDSATEWTTEPQLCSWGTPFLLETSSWQRWRCGKFHHMDIKRERLMLCIGQVVNGRLSLANRLRALIQPSMEKSSPFPSILSLRISCVWTFTATTAPAIPFVSVQQRCSW